MGPPQLQQVVGQGHQGEFGSQFAGTPEQELPEAPGLLDEPVDWLGDGLAPGVGRLSFRGLRFGPHSGEQG